MISLAKLPASRIEIVEASIGSVKLHVKQKLPHDWYTVKYVFILLGCTVSRREEIHTLTQKTNFHKIYRFPGMILAALFWPDTQRRGSTVIPPLPLGHCHLKKYTVF